MHNGKAARGVAHWNYRTGERSILYRHLPRELNKRAREVERDPELRGLRDEITVLTVRETELLDQLEKYPPPPWGDVQRALADYLFAPAENKAASLERLRDAVQRGPDAAQTYSRTWLELREVFQEKAKLVAVEWKRLADMKALVQVDEVIGLFMSAMDLLREVELAEPRPKPTEVLRLFQGRLMGMLRKDGG
jgi:hypothetical protein